MELTKEHLHEYQLRASEFIQQRPGAALFIEMGLGKTISTLTAIAELKERGEISGVLVVAPKRVAVSVWPAEVRKWQHTNHLQCVVVAGTAAKRAKLLQQPADIYVIGRDNVAWLIEKHPRFLSKVDMLVVDESSSFKSIKAKRFKALQRVVRHFKRRVILTGTPSPNSLLELWPQLYIVDFGRRLGENYYMFRRQFFRQREFSTFTLWEPYRWTAEAIQKRIEDVTISLRASDYLQLPDTIYNNVPVILNRKARSVYNEVRDTYAAMLANGETVSAANAAVLVGKLLQMAGGFVYNDDGKPELLHTDKLEALTELVESINEPVIVVYNYQHERAAIQDALKSYKPRVLSGARDIEEWNAGDIDVLLLHPKSAGHGLNLQAGGRHLVWYTPTFSLEAYQQTNARIVRQGQQRKTFIHHLVSQDTVDERVYKALAKKERVQDRLVDMLKKT